ncbi:hypothetical protein N657DRAFT_641261 [Parathielavia appendiculata]|uniref:Uncharacterized protein n=1 Tax=Parathielavia appendiculata TaxID=2587402 RepID=A0AAN6U6F0_9PEZI|nr:hypothetical protein N657DRAFT_641261 [Parathielavia appendiculata]
MLPRLLAVPCPWAPNSVLSWFLLLFPISCSGTGAMQTGLPFLRGYRHGQQPR